MHFRVDDLFLLHGVTTLAAGIPFRVLPGLHPLRQEREDLLRIAAEPHLHGNDLPDLGGVDVDVDDFRLPGVGGDRSGHAVIEPHADGHQHVAGIRHDVRGHVSVHADHSAVEREIGRQGAQAQERGSRRDIPLLEERLQFLLRMAEDDALAIHDEGTLGRVQQGNRLVQGNFRNLRVGDIAADEVAFLILEIRQAHLRVLGEVQDHGARTAAPGNVESPGDGPRHLVRRADLVVPLADGTGQADDIGLLERIRAQGGGGHLPGDDHHRGGIGHRIMDTGDDVRRAGARGDDHDTGIAFHAGIALGRVDGSLFVPHQDMADAVLITAQAVVHGHDLPAGIPEDGIHALLDEGQPQCFRTCNHIFLLSFVLLCHFELSREISRRPCQRS